MVFRLIYLVFAFFDCSRTTNKCSFVNMAVTLCENVVIFGGMIVASCAIKCAHNGFLTRPMNIAVYVGVCVCMCIVVRLLFLQFHGEHELILQCRNQQLSNYILAFLGSHIQSTLGSLK